MEDSFCPEAWEAWPPWLEDEAARPDALEDIVVLEEERVSEEDWDWLEELLW